MWNKNLEINFLFYQSNHIIEFINRLNEAEIKIINIGFILVFNNSKNEKCIIVKLNDNYGIIDINDNIIVPIIYEGLNKTDIENIFKVEKNRKMGLIDSNNTIVVPVEYDNIWVYTEYIKVDQIYIIYCA